MGTNIFFILGLGFPVDNVRHNGDMFSPFWPSLPDPGRQPNVPFLVHVIFWKLDYDLWSASSEPLTDFLAYLEP